jgi:alkylation response protein AidB-like acyl-CoA dehydrogenase
VRIHFTTGRDVRVARVYDGSSEVQQIVIAQRLRKGDVETR